MYEPPMSECLRLLKQDRQGCNKYMYMYISARQSVQLMAETAQETEATHAHVYRLGEYCPAR